MARTRPAYAPEFRDSQHIELERIDAGPVESQLGRFHFGGYRMATGKKPASDAGKILSNPKSTKQEKEIAVSDLAQAKSRPKPKGK